MSAFPDAVVFAADRERALGAVAETARAQGAEPQGDRPTRARCVVCRAVNMGHHPPSRHHQPGWPATTAPASQAADAHDAASPATGRHLWRRDCHLHEQHRPAGSRPPARQAVNGRALGCTWIAGQARPWCHAPGENRVHTPTDLESPSQFGLGCPQVVSSSVRCLKSAPADRSTHRSLVPWSTNMGHPTPSRTSVR